METAVPDALEGLVMSSANRRLPEELWAHVASYASGPTWRTRRGELLALRAASKYLRDAVARAVVRRAKAGHERKILRGSLGLIDKPPRSKSSR